MTRGGDPLIRRELALDPLIRRELALDLIGARLEALTEVDDPVDARMIARARAYYYIYQEEAYDE
jgi:tRNA U38,U39,U40 pseudouridine synthase TruA